MTVFLKVSFFHDTLQLENSTQIMFPIKYGLSKTIYQKSFSKSVFIFHTSIICRKILVFIEITVELPRLKNNLLEKKNF